MGASNGKPLSGMRVADFSLHAAGPFCTHLLSLLGAECIKIESALRPDIFRKPHPVYGRMEAATFDQVASNKLSVMLNLKTPRGAELARRIVAISDVVVESFRPGVMKQLGLDYDRLKAVKPDIVMVSLSASGQTSPESRYAGYAPLFSAWGGLGYLTGYRDGPPVEIRHVMDHGSGLATALAALAALYGRKRTGRGQHVDVAARDVASSFIGEALLACAVTRNVPPRQGNDDDSMAPHGVYPCKGEDDWVTIAVRSEPEWRRLVEATGKEEWRADPRFADPDRRWKNREALDREVAAWTRARTREEVTEALQAVGVAAFPSYNARDIVSDDHLRRRSVITELAGPRGERRSVVGPPWRFSKTPAAIESWTPELGQHNKYVFGDLLGLSEEEIGRLAEEKVLF